MTNTEIKAILTNIFDNQYVANDILFDKIEIEAREKYTLVVSEIKGLKHELRNALVKIIYKPIIRNSIWGFGYEPLYTITENDCEDLSISNMYQLMHTYSQTRNDLFRVISRRYRDARDLYIYKLKKKNKIANRLGNDNFDDYEDD